MRLSRHVGEEAGSLEGGARSASVKPRLMGLGGSVATEVGVRGAWLRNSGPSCRGCSRQAWDTAG
jgi:hypothetical protein